MGEKKQIKVEELDPTFLFTWRGRMGEVGGYHSHDHPELAFIISGEGKYRIEDEIFDVKEGDVLILNPGVRHEAMDIGESDNKAVEFFIGFSDIRIPGYPDNHLPIPDDGCIIHSEGEFKQKVFRICAFMETENNVHNEGRYFVLKAYLMLLIMLVIREQSEVGKKVAGYSFESMNKKYVVERIITYFEDHYSEKISLDQISENMYLSPFYISKIFKSEIGLTPIRHLINIRLDKAKELLETDGVSSIQEIAAKVGYDDAYHFSKLFKKRFGMAPSQVRKQAMENRH